MTTSDKTLFAAPKPVGILSRVKDGLTIYKDQSGRRFMFIVTSNSYTDRENETIATKALQSYVDRAWAVEDKCLPDNPLLFWHDGQPIGDVIWTDMEGPFLLEVAKERPNQVVRLTTKGRIWKTSIKAIWDAIEKGTYRWGASHGFRYPDSGFKDGVYSQIAKFETSVLPLDAAANPYTFAGVMDDMNKDKVLADLLKTPGVADKFRKGVRAVKQELDKRGLEHKALEQTQLKGIMENLSGALDQFLAKVSDSPDPALKDQLMAAIVSALASAPAGEPDGDEGMDTETMEGDDMPAAEAPAADDEEKAVPAVFTGKQLKLLERLITSQESLTNDGIEMRKAVVKVAEAVVPLADVPESVKSLEERLAAIEKRLNGAPKRAAAAPETVVEDKELTKKAKEQAEKYEELFPGLGIKLKPVDGK